MAPGHDTLGKVAAFRDWIVALVQQEEASLILRYDCSLKSSIFVCFSVWCRTFKVSEGEA